MPRRSRKAPAAAPSPAELERQHRAAVERRAIADCEASGASWADVGPGGRVERMAIAEATLRSEAAQPPGDAPSAPSPPPDLAAELDRRDKRLMAVLGKAFGQVVREYVGERLAPLVDRAAKLEARLASAESRVAELETALADLRASHARP